MEYEFPSPEKEAKYKQDLSLIKGLVAKNIECPRCSFKCGVKYGIVTGYESFKCPRCKLEFVVDLRTFRRVPGFKKPNMLISKDDNLLPIFN